MRFARFEIEGVSRNKIPTKACHTLLCILAKNARLGGMHNFTCCNLINSNPPMGCSSITFHFLRQGIGPTNCEIRGGACIAGIERTDNGSLRDSFDSSIACFVLCSNQKCFQVSNRLTRTDLRVDKGRYNSIGCGVCATCGLPCASLTCFLIYFNACRAEERKITRDTL